MKEWVWVSKDGKSHDYFKRRDEAVEALCEEEREQPGITAGGMVLAYDENGEEVGEPEWIEDLLVEARSSKAGVSFVILGESGGLFAVVGGAGSFGKRGSSHPASRRPPSRAKGTRVPSEVGMAGG